jgi:hypothetical protein
MRLFSKARLVHDPIPTDGSLPSLAARLRCRETCQESDSSALIATLARYFLLTGRRVGMGCTINPREVGKTQASRGSKPHKQARFTMRPIDRGIAVAREAD